MTALRKPLEPAPDPKAEAALAASMARLQSRCTEVEGKRAASVIDRKLMDAGALKPGEVIDLGTGEIQQKQVNGGSGEPLGVTGRAEQTHDLAQPKPSPTPASLEWQKKPEDEGKMTLKTLCGRYSCCKIVVNGKTTYEVWHMVPSGNWFNCVARGMESFAKARELAEEHVRR